MRSFWTYCAVASLVALMLVGGRPAAEAGKRKVPPREELINFLLGPRYTQWLVGAVARMATEEEIERYLALRSDGEAERFIDEFWARREHLAPWTVGSIEELYERRAEAADRLFSEGTFQGRRTDRGAIYVLYGPPTESRFDMPPGGRPGQEPVESWWYSPEVGVGLDGQRPGSVYRFQKRGEVTVFYRAQAPGSRLR